MRHKRGNIARIKHIIDAISEIELFLDGVSLEMFLKNREKILAVERLLGIIGEATNHISEEILNNSEYSTPWRKIIDTRNLIVHEYFKVDYTSIYDIATNKIIPLKKDIELILKKLE